MSKNFIFIILGLISAVLTYIFSPSLVGLVEWTVTDRLPREFLRLLIASELVAFAGFVSMFGLTFFILYLIFPVSYIWHHIVSAKRLIAALPVVSNPVRRTGKKTFLSELKGLGFIRDLTESYAVYLIEGPEEDVSVQALKNPRLVKKINNKNEKLKITPVRAAAPAEVIFNGYSMLTDNLQLSFFTIYARALAMVGLICLGLSAVAFLIAPGGQAAAPLSLLQPGMVALLYCLISAVIISVLGRWLDLILSQNVNILARSINGLFYQGEWPQDKDGQAENSTEMAFIKKLDVTLTDNLDKPMKEIAKAMKAISVEQEKKLVDILNKTLRAFSDSLDKKNAGDTAALTKALKESAQAAEAMKKHFSEASGQFSKQMDKQATAIAKHLADMQKILGNNQKAAQQGTGKILSAVTAEVDKTYARLGSFMESSLSKLDEKQTAIETAVDDKDSILKDLHNTAKDLGTISNASGRLLEKFNALAKEMDSVLKIIQENGFDNSPASSEAGDKLKLALLDLRKANRDKTSKLPNM